MCAFKNGNNIEPYLFSIGLLARNNKRAVLREWHKRPKSVVNLHVEYAKQKLFLQVEQLQAFTSNLIKNAIQRTACDHRWRCAEIRSTSDLRATCRANLPSTHTTHFNALLNSASDLHLPARMASFFENSKIGYLRNGILDCFWDFTEIILKNCQD